MGQRTRSRSPGERLEAATKPKKSRSHSARRQEEAPGVSEEGKREREKEKGAKGRRN